MLYRSVMTLYEDDQTQWEISERLGVSQSFISRVCSRFRETRSYWRPVQGRNQLTTARQDSYLVTSAPRDRNDLQIDLHPTYLIRISD